MCSTGVAFAQVKHAMPDEAVKAWLGSLGQGTCDNATRNTSTHLSPIARANSFKYIFILYIYIYLYLFWMSFVKAVPESQSF